MKNGSTKRTISRVLAFVMLVSAMFTNMISANADVNGVLGADDVISAASAIAEDIVDSDVEDLAATVPDDIAGYDHLLDYTLAKETTDKAKYAPTDSFFTVVGDVQTRLGSSGSPNAIEIGKDDTGSIQFTVDTKSDVIMYLASTGSADTNISDWAFAEVNTATIKGSGTVVKTTDNLNGAPTYKGTVDPGTYKVYSPDGTENNRNLRVYYIGVKPAAGSSTEESTEAPTEAVTTAPSQGGDTDSTEWEAHPQAVPTEVNITYPLDGIYSGKVRVDINFDVTGGSLSNGSVLTLKAKKPTADSLIEEIDHDAALRIVGGVPGLGKDNAKAEANPFTGATIKETGNELSFILDTDTGKLTATFNGVTVETDNRTDKPAAIGNSNVGSLKIGDRPVVINSLTVYTAKEGGATEASTETSTAAPEASTETSTAAPITPESGKININAEATPNTADADKAETVDVAFKVSGNSANNGFNNYTVYVDFDPAKLQPVSAEDGDISLGEGFVDAAGQPIDGGIIASNKANIEAQFVNVPKASDPGFEGKGDGAKTQAELGRIKVGYCIYDNGFASAPQGQLPEFTTDGTLFTIKFKAIAPTEENQPTAVSLVSGIVDTVSADMTIASELEVATTPANVTITGTVTTEEPGSETTSNEAPVSDHYDTFPGATAAAQAPEAVDWKSEDGKITVTHGTTLRNSEAEGNGTVTVPESGFKYDFYYRSSGGDKEYTFTPEQEALLVAGAKASSKWRDLLVLDNTSDAPVDWTIDIKIANDKGSHIFLLDDAASTTVEEVLYAEANSSGASAYYTVKVTVPAGKAAVLTGTGTDGVFYGYQVDAEASEPATHYKTFPGATAAAQAPEAVDWKSEDGKVTVAHGTTLRNSEAEGNGTVTVPESGFKYDFYYRSSGGDKEYTFTPEQEALLVAGAKASSKWRDLLVLDNTSDVPVDWTIDIKIANDKGSHIFLLDDAASTTVEEVLYAEANSSGASAYYTVKVTVPAGKAAVLTGTGTDGVFYGYQVDYTPGGDTPTPGEFTFNAENEQTDNEIKFNFDNNPGISNFLVEITYNPAEIIATNGEFAGDFKAVTDATNVNSMIAYVPVAGDPDYSGADGTKNAAQLGKIRLGATTAAPAYNVSKSTAPVISLTFAKQDNFTGEAHVDVKVVTAGDGSQTIACASAVDCHNHAGSIVISGGSEPTTEEPSTSEPSTSEPGTSEPSTSEPSTSAPRPSGGGGGGGGHPRTTTTTEAAAEATTAEKTEPVTKEVDGKTIVIDPPTIEDPSKGGFTDLGDYGWAQDAIERLARLGIVSGIGDKLFGPSLPCRRCDFAILINRALGLSVSATPKNFYDNVDTSKYYYNDVLIGYNAGILSGYGDNNFKPENYCTREEMFVLVAKTLEYLGEDVTSTSQSVLNKYTDVADISWWSAPYCAFLTDAGIVTGTPGGYAEPDRYINRAEMAVMINKDYDYALEVLARQMNSGTQANAELLDEAAEGADTEATTVEADSEETTEADAEATTEAEAEADAETTTAAE